MKIALIGYGKMGKEIEKIAITKGYEISLKVTSQNADFSPSDLSDTDVAIEFSRPEYALDNINKCFEANTPVVVGTTGWYHEFENIKNQCEQGNQALIHATNFSVGVNIFFKINQLLAQYMNHQSNYRATVEEIHHTAKLDAPSGTGITIGEQIISEIDTLSKWENNESNEQDVLPLVSERIDPAPGTHTVTYKSDIDTISIEHIAHNRIGFASGALLAAEWLLDKKGMFTMDDVLKLKN